MQAYILKVIELLAKYGLDKLNRALIFGAVIVTALAILSGTLEFSTMWFTFFFRWTHVLSGVMWIGLLWYFNFVQIPSMPQIPDDQKPAVTKVIAPTALFWFRYAALATVVTGLIVALFNGYLFRAIFLGIGTGGGQARYIGIGMWLAMIMAYNVWMIIWPNQQKALGIVPVPDDEKKAAGRMAMLTSRFNTMLSIPMLYFMVAAQNIS